MTTFQKLAQHASRTLQALDEFAQTALDADTDFDVRECMTLRRDATCDDSASDDSRAFFRDIELHHAHSRKVSY